MEVEKRRFYTQCVQIKYFEASWPGAPVAHRIQPLHGSMHAHTKKRHHDDEGNQQLWSRSDKDEQREHAQNYAFMLHNLMVVIQDYLLLNDDDNRRGQQSSLELVNSTAQRRGDNRICIWLEPSMPCVDCGLWTGRFCDYCRAADRVPSERWCDGQPTPLCSQCDNKYRACHFCRRITWCQPHPWGSTNTNLQQ